MSGHPVTLLYHLIGATPPEADRDELRLFVEPPRFERQLASLVKRGFRTLRLDEYAAALRSGRRPRRALLLTFDDADAQSIELVTPCLMRHGFSAVMFVPVQYINGPNRWDTGHRCLLGRQIATAEQLKDMLRGPWEIGSHGMIHEDLRRVDPPTCLRQLVEARERLSAIAGRPVLDLGYPYGAADAMVRENARLAGYRMAFTSIDGVATGRYNLPRRAVLGQDRAPAFFAKTLPGAHMFYRARSIKQFVNRSRPHANRVDLVP